MKRFAFILSALIFSGATIAETESRVLTGKTDLIIRHDRNQEINRTGFFERDARTPTRSNPGETVGEARRYVAEYAAKMIESQFYSEAGIYFKLHYSSAGGFSALTSTQSYVHNEFSNYDEFGILKDGVTYPNLILRMLRNDAKVVDEYQEDADIQFRDYDAGYEIDAQDHARFLNLVLHEMVHGLGFTNYLCYRGEEHCKTGDEEVKTDIGSHIHVASPYDSKWADLSMNDRYLAAKEDDLLFYYGDEALKSYISENVLGNSGNTEGIMLHAGLTDAGELDSQTLSHISPLVESTELMKSRVGNTTHLGAAAYILCDIGWCRDNGFVTDFELSYQQLDRLEIEEEAEMTYTVTNPDSRTIENVFIDFEYYNAELLTDNIPENCSVLDTVVTCSMGNLLSNESKSIDVPFLAKEEGTYRIMANTYSKSYIVDADGFNNVNVHIVEVGEPPYLEISIPTEFTQDEETAFSTKPTFTSNVVPVFNWNIDDDAGLNIGLTQNQSTGEVAFELPSIDENKTIKLKLTAQYSNQIQSINVTVNITAKSNDDGNDDGGNDTGGNDTGGNDTGGNDTGGNDTGGNDSNQEKSSSGGSMGFFSVLLILTSVFRRFK